MSASARSPFAYTVLRAVPRVERAEFINAGVVLFCRERRFLDARTGLDCGRLAAIAPDCDSDEIAAQLAAIERVARGDSSAGPIASLAKAERFLGNDKANEFITRPYRAGFVVPEKV